MRAPRRKLLLGTVGVLLVVLGLAVAASLRAKPITSRDGLVWAAEPGGISRSSAGTGVGGVLEKDDRGCLVVALPPDSYTVIWPRGTRWTSAQRDAVQVGDVVVPVGATFEGATP